MQQIQQAQRERVASWMFDRLPAQAAALDTLHMAA